jgi:hypothetical protein
MAAFHRSGPDAVLGQVLLDVGQVHRRHGRAVFFDVATDRAKRQPAKLPTTGTSMLRV